MTADRVDVLTPCRNAEPYLRECLESVRAQGDVVRKHIVVDGGSTDDSVRILGDSARDPPHLEWYSQPDGGQSEALNRALDRVETAYFGWLNADDRYLPGGLEALLAASGLPPGPAVIYGDYHRIDARGEVTARRPQPSFSRWDCVHAYLTVHNTAAIFRTDLVRRLGGFDRTLDFAMDYDLVMRLADHGEVRHTRAWVGQFREHPSAKSSRLRDLGRAEVRRLRARRTGRGGVSLGLLRVVGLARVLARMAREGCLPARIFPAA